MSVSDALRVQQSPTAGNPEVCSEGNPTASRLRRETRLMRAASPVGCDGKRV